MSRTDSRMDEPPDFAAGRTLWQRCRHIETPDDETEREAIWAPAARLAETPAPEDWEAVELRSDLARHLDRTDWPLTRHRLVEILTERNAGDRLVELAGSLPAGHSYRNLGELARALDLEPDERRR